MAKNFKQINNPAMQFITAEEEPATEKDTDNTQHTQNTQSTQKRNNGDLKGKRFNLLFYSADTLEALKVIAKLKNADSVNALINQVLTDYTEAHADSIKKYNDLING